MRVTKNSGDALHVPRGRCKIPNGAGGEPMAKSKRVRDFPAALLFPRLFQPLALFAAIFSRRSSRLPPAPPTQRSYLNLGR